jgi:3-oxoacyl-[acyl-carrier-protein] synthase-3
MTRAPVGIVDVSRYEPERVVTAAEISSWSDIPEAVIVDRFGLRSKHLSRPDEHVSDMCVAAARPLLARNDAGDIDCVAYFGSHWKDYAVWQAAPKVQHALGIEGYAVEFVNVSAGAPVALKIASDMLAADPDLRSLLLVGACKEGHLIDYRNPRARFMFNFGDGAVAVLLRRGETRNAVLGSSLYTDGSFSDFVNVPAGGSVHPATYETVDRGMHALDVTDPADMKARLDPVTMKNFVRVAREACERSGIELADVDHLLPIHMKRSIHETLLLELGIEPDRAHYLDTHGHMSALDPFVSMSIARDAGTFRDGDNVMLLAAGTGYTWAASVVRWGTPS